MLEVTDACIDVWGAGRVGMHLAPRCDAQSMGDSDPPATFSYVANELGRRNLAFLFTRERLADPRVWGAWFVGLAVLVTMEVRWGALRASSTLMDHPATGAQRLLRGRAAVAILTLAFFALLFMPTPIAL